MNKITKTLKKILFLLELLLCKILQDLV